MNENLRKLMLAAGYAAPELAQRAQQLAELLIRECAGRVDNILRERKDGGGTMGDDIREHFGVEQ